MVAVGISRTLCTDIQAPSFTYKLLQAGHGPNRPSNQLGRSQLYVVITLGYLGYKANNFLSIVASKGLVDGGEAARPGSAWPGARLGSLLTRLPTADYRLPTTDCQNQEQP